MLHYAQILLHYAFNTFTVDPSPARVINYNRALKCQCNFMSESTNYQHNLQLQAVNVLRSLIASPYKSQPCQSL